LNICNFGLEDTIRPPFQLAPATGMTTESKGFHPHPELVEGLVPQIHGLAFDRVRVRLRVRTPPNTHKNT